MEEICLMWCECWIEFLKWCDIGTEKNVIELSVQLMFPKMETLSWDLITLIVSFNLSSAEKSQSRKPTAAMFFLTICQLYHHAYATLGKKWRRYAWNNLWRLGKNENIDRLVGRVTRSVCEKNRPKWSPNPFFVEINALSWKKVAQNCGLLL
jgi:hypothetical protein